MQGTTKYTTTKAKNKLASFHRAARTRRASQHALVLHDSAALQCHVQEKLTKCSLGAFKASAPHQLRAPVVVQERAVERVLRRVVRHVRCQLRHIAARILQHATSCSVAHNHACWHHMLHHY